jgi:hypothetical protein
MELSWKGHASLSHWHIKARGENGHGASTMEPAGMVQALSVSSIPSPHVFSLSHRGAWGGVGSEMPTLLDVEGQMKLTP